MEYYRSPSAMTALPAHPLLSDLPEGPGALRSVVQGLVLHREWASDYGVEAGMLRVGEQNLRSAAEVLGRAFEISAEPVAAAREAGSRLRPPRPAARAVPHRRGGLAGGPGRRGRP